jgi:hypothetical protein
VKLFRRSGSVADPVLRPSAAFLWAATGIVLAVGLTAVLLVVYRTADAQRVSTLLDIVRIGLSVGAGTGGLFALWLATRRQRSAEQTLALQKDVSHSTVADSTERRITDQYSKAIDQLGHEKAAVRLGAVYSLERIAQDHPGHRQTVVDVFCSYLRLPCGAACDEAGPAPESRDEAAELEVRRTVQDMIWTHLGDPEKRDFKDKFWPGMSLDLSRTILFSPIFRHLSVRALKCENTVFHGVADLAGIRVEEVAGFGGAQFFGKAILAGAVFRGGLALISSAFEADLDLAAIDVARPFALTECHFGGNVVLTGRPGGSLTISECHFVGDVLLDKGKFDLLFIQDSEFESGFVTDDLELETMAIVVGSSFRTAPDRHKGILHVESLNNADELSRSVAKHFGLKL